MKTINRRNFIKESALTAGVAITAPYYIKEFIRRSPNDRINVGIIGIGKSDPANGIAGGRGQAHIQSYAQIPDVRIAVLCEADERLFPVGVKQVETLTGTKPKTEWDYQRLLDDKDIDVISIATPDHWHGLLTVLACQAGKDVYVEKPAHKYISEGRKMIDAARKYNRVVQNGIPPRSSKALKEGVKFAREGKLGKVYMGRGITFTYRDSIGHVKDSPVPDGVHWDRFLGPAPLRPFNTNRHTYKWHWFWDTSTTEFGNNGIYRMDAARCAMNINTHPVKVHCAGGLYCQDSDQEVPNILIAVYEYENGMIIQNEVRSLYTNPEGVEGGRCFIYGDQGWMSINANGFKTYFGKNNEPGPGLSDSDLPQGERTNNWKNFIDCVKSRKIEELDCDIAEGHLSACIGHLGVIAYRTGRKLMFDPKSETFGDDKEANSYLTRNYRAPYLMPDKI